MLLLEPPSTVTLYALGGIAPDVDVVTARSPVSAAQLTAKAAVAVPPGGTITVRDGPFATVQFPATPASTTVRGPMGIPVRRLVGLLPVGCGRPPSTATVSA